MFMSFISKSMNIAQNFNVWEISFFKFYLVAVTLLLSIWFPVLLTADLWIYITISVILLILTFSVMIQQQGNFYKKIFKKWFWCHIFKKMSMFDISIFKLTMVSFWLLLAKLFPIVLTVHIARYIIIAGLFIWYYFYPIFHTKK